MNKTGIKIESCSANPTDLPKSAKKNANLSLSSAISRIIRIRASQARRQNREKELTLNQIHGRSRAPNLRSKIAPWSPIRSWPPLRPREIPSPPVPGPRPPLGSWPGGRRPLPSPLAPPSRPPTDA